MCIRDRNIPYLDLSVIFLLFCEETEDIAATLMITNKYLNYWSVDKEELYQRALVNMVNKYPPVLMKIWFGLVFLCIGLTRVRLGSHTKTILQRKDGYESDDAPIDYGNGAGDINPDDVESISVLKGPAATALYGSRAA